MVEEEEMSRAAAEVIDPFILLCQYDDYFVYYFSMFT